jgi:hypothetical protein
MTQFWKKERNINQLTFFSINWTAIEEASKLWSKEKNRWMIKHCVGIAGVNQVLHKWKQLPSPLCHRCNQEESTSHVWNCKGGNSLGIWKESLKELDIWMKNVNTEPLLHSIIIKNLHTWISDSNGNQVRNELEKAQDIIGWKYVIEGVLPLAWSKHQDLYYKQKDKSNSGHKWLVNLIHRLWIIAWKLWEERNTHTHKIRKENRSIELNSEIQNILQGEQPHYCTFLFTTKVKESIHKNLSLLKEIGYKQ